MPPTCSPRAAPIENTVKLHTEPKAGTKTWPPSFSAKLTTDTEFKHGYVHDTSNNFTQTSVQEAQTKSECAETNGVDYANGKISVAMKLSNRSDLSFKVKELRIIAYQITTGSNSVSSGRWSPMSGPREGMFLGPCGELTMTVKKTDIGADVMKALVRNPSALMFEVGGYSLFQLDEWGVNETLDDTQRIAALIDNEVSEQNRVVTTLMSDIRDPLQSPYAIRRAMNYVAAAARGRLPGSMQIVADAAINLRRSLDELTNPVVEKLALRVEKMLGHEMKNLTYVGPAKWARWVNLYKREIYLSRPDLFAGGSAELRATLHQVQDLGDAKVALLQQHGYKIDALEGYYFPQFWENDPKSLQSALRGKVSVAKDRTFGDVIEGLENGLTPRNMSVRDILVAHDKMLNQGFGDVTLRNDYSTGVRVQQTLSVSNIFLLYPQWVDVPMNYGFSVLGPSAPALTVVSPTSPIQGLAFDNGDILYAQAQWQHNVASTNSLYPEFVIHPHVHFSTVGAGLPDATHSNVTWQIEWEWASLNNFFTNTWSRGTNSATFGVYTNYMHYLLSLGPITNVVPPGISAVFRCRLTRPASGVRDYSNAHYVILDAMDVHIPVGNVRILGSRTDSAP